MTLQKLLKSFLWTFRYLFFTLISRISSVIPKEEGLWLFGSWGGKRFSSSTKYLYLYIVKNHKNIKPFWITRNNQVFSHLRKKSLPVYKKISLRGIWLSFRAEVIFVSNEIYDVSPGFADGALFIQLFHMVLPIKYMMRGDSKVTREVFRTFNFKRKIRTLLISPHMFRKPDYYITSSDWMAKEVTHSKLQADISKILVTGFPRTDAILNKDYNNTDFVNKILFTNDNKETSNIIYYLPTHRDHDLIFNPFDYGFDEALFSQFLYKTNSLLVIRFHPRDKEYREHFVNFDCDRIIKEPEGFQDPYAILKRASILISDYGSIFSDFLLLNKPIIFAKFDHKNYVNIRGLNWDYDKYTPGYKAESWGDILKILSSIIINNEDSFYSQRNKLKNLIYKFQDTNNSSRLVKTVENILNKKI